MRRITATVAAILLGWAAPVWAETIELVTYYPTSASTGDLHVRSITVGTGYQGVDMSANDGVALVNEQLGIGTTTPSGSLHVVGPANQPDTVLFMPGTGTGTMRVGIGTANPPSLLGLGVNTNLGATRQAITIGNAGVGAPAVEGASSNGDKLVMWNAIAPQTPYKAAIGIDVNSQLWLQSSGNNANNKITFYTSNNSVTPLERMRIDAQGKVGIGTANPAALLNVHSAAGQAALVLSGLSDAGQTYSALYFSDQGQNAATNGWAVSFKNDTGLASARSLQIVRNPTGVGGGAYLQINPNGNTGIGTTAPAYKLEVNGLFATRGNRTFLFGADNLNYHWIMEGGATEGTNNALGFHFPSRTVLVGYPTSGPIWNLTVSGATLKPGGGPWGSTSDVRLKKNIHPMSGALEKLLALRGVTFEWKDPASQGNLTGTQMGMIGQEVERVFPEWVSEDPAGMRVVSIRGFEALTVEAVREQQREIAKLNERNDLLEKEVRLLKEEISRRGKP